MECPAYWKTTLEDVDQVIEGVKKGKKTILCLTPGGKPVHMMFYGTENNLFRTANLSSALGANSPDSFADKSAADYRPTLMLVGCIHGGEFEGLSALLNLIAVMETGKDIAGQNFEVEVAEFKKVNWIIIPCANPDGRSHVPFNSMIGKTMKELRYYNQGTWLDGTLCGWPECKKIHPIKGKTDFLGGYFNEDGVNLMHDNFFGDKAAETDALLRTAEKYVPDFMVLLHGGGNCIGHMLSPAYVNDTIYRKIDTERRRMISACEKEGLQFSDTKGEPGRSEEVWSSFNLISAMSHVCGTPCVTYESNQGLNAKGLQMTYEEIYRQHWLLFKTLCENVIEERKARNQITEVREEIRR